MVREHNSVLAASEKRLLIRMAGSLPDWVNSDHLTFTGAAAMLAIGACFWAGGGALWLVIPLLALNWFGDSLDGTLARVRRHERPRYGYYVDQSEYNYYFREGFRRGYEDGYNSRYHYGRRSNGRYVVLASILAGILVLEAITDN